MKTINHISGTCTCGNHVIQYEGSVCEVCMGIVGSSQTENSKDSFFDAEYFEILDALEQAHHEEWDFAA